MAQSPTKSNEPLISIIIPTHNLEKILYETLDSVISQEYCNFEVLVIDDRSTDHTRDIIEKYATRDSRIRLLTNIHQQGAGGARNTGLAQARGEWITFLDGDDVWINNTLKLQIDSLTTFPDAKLITADCLLLEPDGTQTRYTEIDEDWKNHYQKANVTDKPYLIKNPVRLFLQDKPTTQTGVLLIKAELFSHTGFFDERLEMFEDQLLWIKLSRYSDELVYIPKPLLLKRQRDGSLTRRGVPGSIWATVGLKQLLNAPDFNVYKPEITTRLAKFTLKNTWHYRNTHQKFKALSSAIDGIRFSPYAISSWKNLIATLLLQ